MIADIPRLPTIEGIANGRLCLSSMDVVPSAKAVTRLGRLQNYG